MLHATWYLARLHEISYVERVKRNKNSHNTVDLRHLSLMSKESKVHSIYNIDSNLNIQIRAELGLKSCNSLNYNRV